MSWPIASVRGDGRDQSRTSPRQRLAASLSWNRAKFVRPQGLTKREAAKHVESFGVGSWIRVQFPAPPPKRRRSENRSQETDVRSQIMIVSHRLLLLPCVVLFAATLAV